MPCINYSLEEGISIKEQGNIKDSKKSTRNYFFKAIQVKHTYQNDPAEAKAVTVKKQNNIIVNVIHQGRVGQRSRRLIFDSSLENSQMVK